MTDLTANDFEWLEDGTPQTIASFTLVNVPLERAERPLFSPRAIEPDVQTNDRDEGRLYVIALDAVGPLQARGVPLRGAGRWRRGTCSSG